MSIADNLHTVNERIRIAAARSGRPPSSVRLIAVSKTKPVEDIIEAAKAGQLAFGENYAQELRDKARQISDNLSTYALKHLSTAVEWHFIGHLQKNKIKYVLPIASWIHTIDSQDLLSEIQNKLANRPTPAEGGSASGGGQPVNCLIEVNIAGEDSKSGIDPDKVFGLVHAFSATWEPAVPPTCKLCGFMCMPPISENPEKSRPYFRRLKNLLDEINSRSIYPEKLTELSMGMTGDFEVAIEEGATMVRVGSAIFGGR